MGGQMNEWQRRLCVVEMNIDELGAMVDEHRWDSHQLCRALHDLLYVLRELTKWSVMAEQRIRALE